MNAARQISEMTGQPELTAADFDVIANIVTQISGIQLSPAKLGMAKSRLQKRLRSLGFTSYRDYISLIQSDRGSQEVGELISAMSTNVTSFNREPHHFEHFRANLVPEIRKLLTERQEVRIWSAGCSNGAEPYTLACEILEAIPEVRQNQLRILGTDIDRHSLAEGLKGVYSKDLITRMNPRLVERWFENEGSEYKINPKVQALVSFKYLNLIEPWPISRKYDAIFCRNVMIYFSQEIQCRLFEGFARHLKPGAFIYIGHSERVVGPTANMFRAVGATTYQFVPEGRRS